MDGTMTGSNPSLLERIGMGSSFEEQPNKTERILPEIMLWKDQLQRKGFAVQVKWKKGPLVIQEISECKRTGINKTG